MTMLTWICDKEDRRTSAFGERRKVIEKGGREGKKEGGCITVCIFKVVGFFTK